MLRAFFAIKCDYLKHNAKYEDVKDLKEKNYASLKFENRQYLLNGIPNEPMQYDALMHYVLFKL